MESFKKSCLKNCYKILKFANFENGGTNIQREFLCAANIFTAAGQQQVCLFRDVKRIVLSF